MVDEKNFNLEDAEKLLPVLELLLTRAIQAKKKIEELDKLFEQVRNRILLYGGITLPYDELAPRKKERDQLAESFKDAVLRIESQGCLIKDLDIGLIDFPSSIADQRVYLCWKLGENHIRYWHHRDEGFANRKPLDFGRGGEPKTPKPN